MPGKGVFMRRSTRTLVVTAFSVVAIALGLSEGGNLFIRPGNEAGNIMMFVGVVVLFGYWSLAACHVQSTMRPQIPSSNAATTPPARIPPHGQPVDGGHAFDVEDGRQMVDAPVADAALSSGGT